MKKRLKALTDLDLRARPDVTCEDWLHWKKGEVFEPPPHFNVAKALERGIVQEVV